MTVYNVLDVYENLIINTGFVLHLCQEFQYINWTVFCI